MMTELKFKEGVEPTSISGDFFYDIVNGYCEPEKFLEEDDATKVRNAVELIRQYELQGINTGVFEES